MRFVGILGRAEFARGDLFDRDDAHHARVRQALQRDQGLRLLTTWPVLTETSALLSSRYNASIQRRAQWRQ